MSKNQGQHPPESELLLYLDGELENGPAESVRRHLDSCWSCRMHAASLQNAILEFARERERSTIPEPPRPWRDIRSDFRRIDESLRPSLMQRIKTGTIFRGGRVAMFCCLATAVAAVTWYSLPHHTNPVQSNAVGPPVGQSGPAQPRVVQPGRRQIADLRHAELPKEPDFVRSNPGSIIHEELAILAQLHALKADLGEPIGLQASAGRLVLTGYGLGPERTQEIKDALAQFPDLTVRLVGPKAIASAGVNQPPTSAPRRPIAFEAELVQYAGGRQSLQRLTESLLDASDQVTMYVHARANLDKRFPLEILSSMTEADRALLDQIKADHMSGARQAAHGLRKLIDPIFERLAIDPHPESSGSSIEAALKVDRLLNAAFAGAQSDLSDHDLYAELRGWLARLLELIG